MTTIGILQIALFFGLILVCAKPLGAYMARRLRRPAHVSAPGAALAGSADLQADRSEGRRGAALDAIHGLAAQLQHLRVPARLPAAARSGVCCRSIRRVSVRPT